MKQLASIDVNIVKKHLNTIRSSVCLERHEMPGEIHEYQFFLGKLETEDFKKLTLWWEFDIHTRGRSCKLNDLLPTAKQLARVQSFIFGDQASGLKPLDLTSADAMELVLVTDNLHSDWFYMIDGNHRTMAHYMQGRSLQDLSVYVCVHPKMRTWIYLPENIRQQP